MDFDRPEGVPQQLAQKLEISRRFETATSLLLLFVDTKRRLLVLPAGRTLIIPFNKGESTEIATKNHNQNCIKNKNML